MDWKIGDQVRLNHGDQGFIKYIGTISCMGDEIYYGIELEKWTVNCLCDYGEIEEISNVITKMGIYPVMRRVILLIGLK